MKPVYNSPPTVHLNFPVVHTTGTGYRHLCVHTHTVASESTKYYCLQYIVLRLKPIGHLRKVLKMAIPN